MAHPHAPRPRRLAWAAEAFVALFAVWLALNGLTAWPLGLAVAALGAALGAAFAPGEARALRLARVPGFAAFFLRESLRGGLDVARRALHPRVPLSPHFVERALRLPPGPPRTLMVSLVSLLPGSLAADLDAERNRLRVHLLAGRNAAELDALEARIAALFGLDRR